MAVHPGLCSTLSETPKTSFLTTRLIWTSAFIPIAEQTSLLDLTKSPNGAPDQNTTSASGSDSYLLKDETGQGSSVSTVSVS